MKEEKHTYSTPGPILINPNKGEKRTLPKKKRKYGKSKGTHSVASLGQSTPNKPHINSHSVLLANKKKLPGGSVYSRLHTAALNKQRVEQRQKPKMTEVSYEASTLINGSFSGQRSAKKRGRNLMDNIYTERNRTPNNYGEKLYQNGLKKMEERERRNYKEKKEREIKKYENLTFRPQINPISKNYGKYGKKKKLEDELIEKGKKTHDMIEKKRSEILFEEQHKHSFKPKINKKSERIIQERSRQFLEESAAM